MHLQRIGHTAADIHSNRTLAQRRMALEGFRSGRFRILVATDIAARGIDVTGIQLVVNFDLPTSAEDYVHRIGRTGRAGQTGHAIAFATPDQHRDVIAIERLIRTSLRVRTLPNGFSLYSPSTRPPSGPAHQVHQERQPDSGSQFSRPSHPPHQRGRHQWKKKSAGRNYGRRSKSW